MVVCTMYAFLTFYIYSSKYKVVQTQHRTVGAYFGRNSRMFFSGSNVFLQIKVLGCLELMIMPVFMICISAFTFQNAATVRLRTGTSMLFLFVLLLPRMISFLVILLYICFFFIFVFFAETHF